MDKPIQHFYPEELCKCYGCGLNNDQGLQLKSYWNGEEAVARFTPQKQHIALPGYVYGGLLASLIDCHGVGTAAAVATAKHKPPAEDQDNPMQRYVTASLHVYFKRPTPLGEELFLRGWLKEERGNKLVVEVEISVKNEVKVRGEVVAAPMPETMK
jgi:acyl-coenzyme A thioesterase PaaI-like protein